MFRCADGQVRICVLSPRQWRAMFDWLGSPAEFADPRYDAIPVRFAAAGQLNPLIAALFAGQGPGRTWWPREPAAASRWPGCSARPRC